MKKQKLKKGRVHRKGEQQEEIEQEILFKKKSQRIK